MNSLYETGAGGSAPKHVLQFVKHVNLRWDSLGEYVYLAVAACFERLAEISGNEKANVLGDCLYKAVGRILKNRKSPSCVVNQIDNQATNYYIALYWADFLQQEHPVYKPIFEELSLNRSHIVDEFKQCQGKQVDLGGLYRFESDKTRAAMNPSSTLNKILSSFGKHNVL